MKWNNKTDRIKHVYNSIYIFQAYLAIGNKSLLQLFVTTE